MKYAFIVLAFLFAGCQTMTKQQRICKKALDYGCVRTDTITKTNTVTVVKDTTIYVYIAGKTVHDTVKVEVNKNGVINSKKSFLETLYATSWAWVENGILQHTLNQKESTIAQTIKDAIKNNSKTETLYITKEVKVPYAVTTNKLNFFQKIFFWIGLLITVSVGGYFGIKYGKKLLI